MFQLYLRLVDHHRWLTLLHFLDTPVIPASVQPHASNPPPGAQPPSSPSISNIEVQPECFGDIQFFVLTQR